MFPCDAEVQEAAVEPSSLSDEELSAELDRLLEESDRLDARRLAIAGEWDARAVWAEQGFPNGPAFLAAGGRLSRAGAFGLLKTARTLRRLPTVAAAVAAGSLTPGKARVLCAAVNERTRDAMIRDQEMMVANAAPLTVDETAMITRYWTARNDPDGASGGDDTANTAHLSATLGGRWQFGGNLDAESGAIFASVWDEMTEAIRRATRHDPDPLTTGRLRATALVEMARRATAANDHSPAAAPSVVVTVAAADLADAQGAARIGDRTVIGSDAVRRLCCDAFVMRLVLGADNQPLAMGRAVRTATRAQRRLLAERDRGCSFPGCDRPPGWCQAHHMIWWDNNGPTNIDNLTLVCDHHHHLIHDKGWTVTWDATANEVVWFKPDGTRHTAPPIAA